MAPTVPHCHGEHGSPSEGHLDANVRMPTGKAHAVDVHTAGYWRGSDVQTQPNQTMAIFEILHPGCIGLFLFGISTGHSKMPDGAS